MFSYLIGNCADGHIIYQRILYKRETAHKKEVQENLKREKEFLSFALESGNIFTFRYKNGIFYFDKEFYHYLDMPEKPISAEEFSNAIHSDEQADFQLNRYKLDSWLPFPADYEEEIRLQQKRLSVVGIPVCTKHEH